MFSDGLAVNGTELVRGLSDALPQDTMIAGGLAADGDRFARTWVLVDGKPASGSRRRGRAGGPLDIGVGSQGGWDTFGPERRVTRSTGNVLYELDGKPALALYKDYLGRARLGPARRPRCASRCRSANRTAPRAPVVRTILADRREGAVDDVRRRRSATAGARS